jgi:hypothetical protein
MDAWGVKGCRQHPDEIVSHLRQEQARVNWMTMMEVVARTVVGGLAFRLDPADEAGSLLDEALRRAEAKGPS